MNKKILSAICFVTLVASCADNDMIGGLTVEKPAELAGYEYLNNYEPLKNNIVRKSGSQFKLGVGTDATQYVNQGLEYSMVNSNFEETEPGNEMKMGFCVNEKGDMDFGTVSSYVNAATDAGLSVYGHTLAWHSQQPVKWLTKLLKDKELDVDPDAKEEKLIHECDYTSGISYQWWHQGVEPYTENGAMVVVNETAKGFWEAQYFADDHITIEEGKTYVVRLLAKASAEASINCILGGWSGAKDQKITIPTDWETIDVTLSGITPGEGHIMLQSGDFVGTIWIKKAQVLTLESPAVEIEVPVHECDYTSGISYQWWHQGVEPYTENGAMVVVNETAKGFWEAQYFADDHITIEEGKTYVVRLLAKASAEASINCILGGWSGAKDQKITIPTEWKTINARLSGITPGDAHVMLQSGDFVGTLWIQKCEVLKIVKANSIPLTPEEKKDTLIWAMDRWIKGMMEACEGKVKAWDVVNEAISGGNPDAEGVYALQHDLEGTKPEDFYWQDYLGDYDYVRTAVRLAREYGPEDIKLFINDYNLEYEWHGNDNKKLQSLIKWIERWESDGVTKIDGIGTQTHISFCADPDIQKKHEELIKNSFQLMANTGKLIRISELDMGYDDANGNKVMTVDMTEEMHKQMSDFYKWIIKTYMEIIPAAQQWGICQWCIKDSPTGSAWRPGEPTGLWMVKKELNGNEVVYRKHTYGGFADGLAGKE